MSRFPAVADVAQDNPLDAAVLFAAVLMVVWALVEIFLARRRIKRVFVKDLGGHLTVAGSLSATLRPGDGQTIGNHHASEVLIKAAAPNRRDWRELPFRPDNERITKAHAADVTIRMFNRGQQPFLATKCYIEIYRPPDAADSCSEHIAFVLPRIVDGTDLGTKEDPETVNWTVEPQEPEQVHVITFRENWREGYGPKYDNEWDMRLLVEFGEGAVTTCEIRPPAL